MPKESSELLDEDIDQSSVVSEDDDDDEELLDVDNASFSSSNSLGSTSMGVTKTSSVAVEVVKEISEVDGSDEWVKEELQLDSLDEDELLEDDESLLEVSLEVHVSEGELVLLVLELEVEDEDEDQSSLVVLEGDELDEARRLADEDVHDGSWVDVELEKLAVEELDESSQVVNE